MLNKQGPGKIDYCDYTWNPISGYCWHECPYCYMRQRWKRFPDMAIQKFRHDFLQDSFPRKPSVIFVGSSSDMLGDWVPAWQIQSVLNVAGIHPGHTFLFLTKNPSRYKDFLIPENCWCGTTVDGTERTSRNCAILETLSVTKKWVSVEPMIEKVHPKDVLFADWIVVGADSRRGENKPPMEWAEDIYCAAMCAGKSVWIKDNYQYHDVVKERPF